ncbi:hypothetical protein [Kribbella sp. NBC_00889]|uniref:hypothetical protein n=1 Tax=Kribbella sp. NBC_00889 TaxID=2975974 RepID=UPI0038678F49|nr:hypothetical protein OG817_44925 [Kribbella sp. NBC_00889]
MLKSLCCIGLLAAAASGCTSKPPAVGDHVPAALVTADIGPAPADPASARHLELAMKASPEVVTFDGAARVVAGWPNAQLPSGAAAVRVTIYSSGGKHLHDVLLPDPTQFRVYGDPSESEGSTVNPHGPQTETQVSLGLSLPLLPDAGVVVVSRRNVVILRTDVTAAVRGSCETQKSQPQCEEWLAAN